MRSIRRWLGLEESDSREARDTETVRRIASELDRLDADDARYIASFAYVLARVAHADLEISPVEVSEMERRVAELGELPPAQAALVVQIAKTQSLTLGGTEDYVVTRQFRDQSTRDQRLALLRCLYAIAAADDDVSHLEDSEIGKVATELGLTTTELAAARSAYREYLAVLKDSR